MPDDPAPDRPPPGRDPEEPEVAGTIFIMLVFLMALGGLWLIMYFQLLRR